MYCRRDLFILAIEMGKSNGYPVTSPGLAIFIKVASANCHSLGVSAPNGGHPQDLT